MQKIQINLTNRKYRMLPLIIGLLVLFYAFYSIIMVLFPLETITAKELLSIDEYGFYMLLMAADLFIFCLIPFILGIWFHSWRLEKNVQLSKNLEMENLSPKDEAHGY